MNDSECGYGIDIEFAEPRRDWQGILATFGLSPERSVSPTVGAAVWSFCEACFKAGGELPDRQLLETVLNLAFESDDEISFAAPLADRHLLAHGGIVEGIGNFRLFHVVVGREAFRAGVRLDWVACRTRPRPHSSGSE